MIGKIKKTLGRIKDDELYSLEQVHKFGIILNTSLEPSKHSIYRLIRSGKLPSVDVGTGKQQRHFVKGSDLKEYIKKTYKL